MQICGGALREFYMSRKYVLRIIAACMAAAAIIFIVAALANPAFGSVWTIGKMRIAVPVKRVFYSVYALITLCVFIGSFFVKD